MISSQMTDGSSVFHPCKRHALDDPGPEHQKNNQHGEKGDHACRHNAAIVHRILSLEIHEAQLHGELIRRIRHDQRPDKEAPGIDPVHNGDGRDGRDAQRQDDAEENPPF